MDGILHLDRELRWSSQEHRAKAPEADALRLGIGWGESDLEKPYILVDSVAGDSHPGSAHLAEIAIRAADGVRMAGGAPARYFCTDMCDGIAQGTDAMDYSLPSRDIIAAAVEMHARSGYYDAVVLVSGCDKAVPAHLMAAARLDLPAIHVPGGSMPAGRGGITVDQIGSIAASMRRGELAPEEYQRWVANAVPSCGSCAFMGTALTSQVVAEVLGLALPYSAVAPANTAVLGEIAERSGRVVMEALRAGRTARTVITADAIENAVMVHAAVGGSTNFMIHLPAIAAEADLSVDLDRVQALNDTVPFLVDARPTGRYPAHLFWYAGGVPRVMWEIRSHLHLSALAATGEPWGGVLDRFNATGHFASDHDELTRLGLTASDVIRSADDPVLEHGAITIMRGNLAPDGAVVKRAAIDPRARYLLGRARVFDDQDGALAAIAERGISPGDIVVVRGEGPRGSGMPEQYYVTSAIAADEELALGTALVTDGRFSGASKGPCIGHVSPEAVAGGPIGKVREGDRILVDVDARRLDLLGGADDAVDELSMARGDELINTRPAYQPIQKSTTGLLALYQALAGPAQHGAVMRPPA